MKWKMFLNSDPFDWKLESQWGDPSYFSLKLVNASHWKFTLLKLKVISLGKIYFWIPIGVNDFNFIDNFNCRTSRY